MLILSCSKNYSLSYSWLSPLCTFMPPEDKAGPWCFACSLLCQIQFYWMSSPSQALFLCDRFGPLPSLPDIDVDFWHHQLFLRPELVAWSLWSSAAGTQVLTVSIRKVSCTQALKTCPTRAICFPREPLREVMVYWLSIVFSIFCNQCAVKNDSTRKLFFLLIVLPCSGAAGIVLC